MPQTVSAENAAKPASAGWVARLMDKCKGPKALHALGVLSFLESSLLPVPIDLAMVPICLARPKELWKIVLVGTIGSVAGAVFGYLIGAFFMDVIGGWLLSLYGMQDSFADFQELYAREGWRAIAAAGITPIPFKVAAIVSGAVAMPFHVFVLTAASIRLIRFALIALVIRIFGAGLQKILDAHSRKFTIIMVAVMIMGFLLVPALL
jgi:membrane protein YqaA with SNARE-associated domain